MKVFYFSAFCLLFIACQPTRYIAYTDQLTKNEVAEDIYYLKNQLIKKHYDLNWEGRSEQILFLLDSLASHAKAQSIEELSDQLRESFGADNALISTETATTAPTLERAVRTLSW